jgi:CRP-like cAMP-binding protein
VTEPHTSLSPLLVRLMSRVDLTQADQDAVLALPQTVRSLRISEHFIRTGDKPTHCCVMLSGFTVRYKVLAQGARQIIGVHMKGDMVDLQNVLLERSDHDVQALTAAKVAIIPRTALEELAFDRPPIGKALWLETLVDGSLFREWIANVGRRDARARIAHLLCEFAIRLDVAGLADTHSYELPMTQEQLGDTLGLTSVHVNRTLKALADEGLIEREQRSVRISDWKKLARAAGFDPAYLHLPKSDGMRLH